MTTPALPAGTPTLEDRLRDRMKSQLVDLVPDETFAALIADAVKKFVHGYEKPADYRNQREHVDGEMKTMIEKEVAKVLAEATISALHAKLTPIIEADQTKEQIDSAADALLLKITPAFFQALVQEMIAPAWKQVGPLVASYLQNEISAGRLHLQGRY